MNISSQIMDTYTNTVLPVIMPSLPSCLQAQEMETNGIHNLNPVEEIFYSCHHELDSL